MGRHELLPGRGRRPGRAALADDSRKYLTDFPDEYCLTSPDQDNCAIIPGFGCPEGFEIMRSSNFTTERCVPKNVEELEKIEREREVFDPNRCAIGYKLDVQPSVDIHRRGDNIGSCIKIRD